MTKTFDELSDGYDQAVTLAKQQLPDPKNWNGPPHYIVPIRLDDVLITDIDQPMALPERSFGEVGGTIEVRFRLTRNGWVLD